MGILGMQACEGTEAVPPNARSHTVLLSGMLVGHRQVRMLPAAGLGCRMRVRGMPCGMPRRTYARGLFACGTPQVLVRMSFGMDASGTVAMKLVAKGTTQEAVEAVHATIQNA